MSLPNQDQPTDLGQEVDLGQPDFTDILDDDADITEAVMAQSNAEGAAGSNAGEMICIGIKFATDFAAKRFGDHWALQQGELVELSDRIDAVMPETDLSPGWALAATVAGIFGPRAMIEFANQAEQQQLEQQGGQDDQAQANAEETKAP